MNNENACASTHGENGRTESINEVLGGTKNALDQAMDIGLKIIKSLGGNTSETPNPVSENIFDSAKSNRDEAVIVARMMEYIAETLGC